jgi:hypothetical protein
MCKVAFCIQVGSSKGQGRVSSTPEAFLNEFVRVETS